MRIEVDSTTARCALCNYDGLFKVICECESIGAPALAFDVRQWPCVAILGEGLADLAGDSLKGGTRGGHATKKAALYGGGPSAAAFHFKPHLGRGVGDPHFVKTIEIRFYNGSF